ncbi:MAG: hypothetical protein J07HQW2_03642 [Haloquadratum walsbyi J07HQW2]|uniref:Transposase n=1 Tax=Haloquadratum walsbyi J07HQW2 TaxID=1238425 RepID=U1PXG8_9EURY|nr:MAG: hypothetical protein J07HQW2_03642 [Haloquadratum walsbyi J07HQW2]
MSLAAMIYNYALARQIFKSIKISPWVYEVPNETGYMQYDYGYITA